MVYKKWTLTEPTGSCSSSGDSSNGRATTISIKLLKLICFDFVSMANCYLIYLKSLYQYKKFDLNILLFINSF